jgi:hypothetical protein
MIPPGKANGKLKRVALVLSLLLAAIVLTPFRLTG